MRAAVPQAGERGLTTVPSLTIDRIRELMIDEIGVGLIVCDFAGVVRLANRCAEKELACGNLLRRIGHTLRCAGASTPSLDAAVAMAARCRSRSLVEISSGPHRLLVTVVPLSASEPHEALAMIMLGSRGLCSPHGLEMLSTVHGLTSAERRVLDDLLHEQTPRAIAEAHRVSLTTVRSQIVSIRAKFGVHSIEGLLRRVAELPPEPGGPGPGGGWVCRDPAPPIRNVQPSRRGGSSPHAGPHPAQVGTASLGQAGAPQPLEDP